MKKTLTDLATFDWIYSNQQVTQSSRHNGTHRIDHEHHDPKRIQQLISHLVIKGVY
jgi:hypothetical protein